MVLFMYLIGQGLQWGFEFRCCWILHCRCRSRVFSCLKDSWWIYFGWFLNRCFLKAPKALTESRAACPELSAAITHSLTRAGVFTHLWPRWQQALAAPLPGRDAEQMSGIRGKDLGRLWGCTVVEVIDCGVVHWSHSLWRHGRGCWACAERSPRMGLGGFVYLNQNQMFSWYLLIKGKRKSIQ